MRYRLSRHVEAHSCPDELLFPTNEIDLVFPARNLPGAGSRGVLLLSSSSHAKWGLFILTSVRTSFLTKKSGRWFRNSSQFYSFHRLPKKFRPTCKIFPS